MNTKEQLSESTNKTQQNALLNKTSAIRCFNIEGRNVTKTDGSTDYKTNSPSTRLLENMELNLGSQSKIQTINTCSEAGYSSRRDVKCNVSTNKDEEHPLMCKGQFIAPIPTDKSVYQFSNYEFSKVAGKNQLLGSGAFGEVYLATNKVDKKRYAIKVMNKVTMEKNKIKHKLIEKEIDIHSRIDHPYIINLRCSHETNDSFFIVMDYAKNGTLYSKIKKMKNGFSEDSAFKYFIQTCSAVSFLHKHFLVHRDLKPENILLDEYNNIKLTDFGWCDYYNCRRPLTEVCGTYEYMAPEIIKMSPYNYKVDIWALGVLLYELLHGETPFFIPDIYKDPSKSSLLFEKIKSNKFKIKEELSDNSKSLIKGLLRINPEERLSMEQIFLHPWVLTKDSNFRSSKRMHTTYLKPNELKFNEAVEIIESPDISVKKNSNLHSDMLSDLRINCNDSDLLTLPPENIPQNTHENSKSELKEEAENSKHIISKYILLNRSNQSNNLPSSRLATGEGQRLIDIFLKTEENEEPIQDFKSQTLKKDRCKNYFDSNYNMDKDSINKIESNRKNYPLNSETSSKLSYAQPDTQILSNYNTENSRVKHIQLNEELHCAYSSTKSIGNLSFDTSKSGNSVVPITKKLSNGELKFTKSASIFNVSNKLPKQKSNKMSSFQNLIVTNTNEDSFKDCNAEYVNTTNFSPSLLAKEEPEGNMFNFNSIDHDLDQARNFDSPLRVPKKNIYSSAFRDHGKSKHDDEGASPSGVRIDFSKTTVKDMPYILKGNLLGQGIYDSPDPKPIGKFNINSECHSESNPKSAKFIFKLQVDDEDDDNSVVSSNTSVVQKSNNGDDDYQYIRQTSKNKLVITSSIKKQKKSSIISEK